MNNKLHGVVISCFILMLSCKTANSQETAEVTAMPECESCDLVGEISRAQLENNKRFNEWFSSNYENYQLNDEAINTLKNSDISQLSFKIIMGTWCSDSQREVPRFTKILDSMNIDKAAVAYYALDADKLSPEKIEDTYNVNFVPSLIVYKNGVELNRIVEMSIRTLEEDLAVILTTNDYQHIYVD